MTHPRDEVWKDQQGFERQLWDPERGEDGRYTCPFCAGRVDVLDGKAKCHGACRRRFRRVRP